MPVTNTREIVETGDDLGLSDLPGRAEGTVYVVAEYDESGFNLLYAADETLAMYEDEEQMYDHFEQIHDYVNVDFTEIDLFTGSLFPEAERVDYLVTRMDYLKIVRIYSGTQGVFIALDPDEPVEPLVEPVVETLQE